MGGKGRQVTESILEALHRGELIIGDGAMGTMLQAYDLPGGIMPELWNHDHPEVIRAIHQAYLDAGSQFLTTNTFGGNRLRMSEAGLAGRTAELTRLGAMLAREVAGEAAWVAGSVGPTGQLMEPYGTLSVALAEEVFAQQVVALADGGVDFVLVETQHDAEEACCAVRAARRSASLPVFCTFAFNAKGRTMMGLAPREAAKRAQEVGADVVGANCGEGPAAIMAALEEMCEATDLPLMAQSNAGVPQAGEGSQAVWDVSPVQMTNHVRTFISLGARIVGGCCGTGPDHIAALVAELRG